MTGTGTMTINPLDRGSPMPLWAQLESELRNRLEAGDFDDGFPTDEDLRQTYGVSRHTVRQAVNHLNKNGVLTRERGRGTVVNRAEFEQSLGTLYSLFQSVESAGVEQTSEVLSLAIVTDPNAAKELGLADDAELLLLARLRSAGGTPLAIDRAWIPVEFGARLLDIDWSRTALYAELERSGSPVPNQGWERLTPIVPNENDRELLGLDVGDGAFFLERLGERDGRRVEWRTTIIRGDRYRFVTEWSAGVASELRPTSL